MKVVTGIIGAILGGLLTSSDQNSHVFRSVLDYGVGGRWRAAPCKSGIDGKPQNRLLEVIVGGALTNGFRR
jgi:hypothetical protein